MASPAATNWEEARGIDFFYRSRAFDWYTLVVGERMDRLSLTNRAMSRMLAITGFIVVLAMLISGYFCGGRRLYKLEGMETTLAQISDGDTSAQMT